MHLVKRDMVLLPTVEIALMLLGRVKLLLWNRGLDMLYEMLRGREVIHS